MKYCVLLVLFFWINSNGFAQRKLSYQQACIDIDYYFAIIDSIHPNMYWHTPKQVIDSFKMTLKEKCKDSVAISELSFLLQQGSHYFDSHTGHGDLWNEYYLKSNNMVFPRVVLREGKVFLKKNGQEIVAINGCKIDDILQSVKNHFGADIPIEAIYVETNISLLFQHILLFMGINAPYCVQIKENDSIYEYLEEGVYYPALKYEVLAFRREFWDSDYKFICYPDSSVAILYYNSSEMDESQIRLFNKFLSDCFRTLEDKQIQNFFIDISRNQGGTDEAHNAIFNSISNEKEGRVLFSKSKMKHPSRKNKFKTRKIRLHLYKRDGYNGNIFVYQSFFSHSAAPTVSELFRLLDRGIIVGTTTEPVTDNYSYLTEFRLPNSRLGAGSATYHHLFCSQKWLGLDANMGIVPDISYPFLIERKLDLSDCMKIIELYKTSKRK